MEKNCVLTHSLTQSPSLYFDAPGTEAFTSEDIEVLESGCIGGQVIKSQTDCTEIILLK